MIRQHRKRSRNRQAGLSLIELMVALLVGIFLVGGMLQIYLSGKQSYNAQEQLARMQESGRFALDMITRDLRRSGYWGGNASVTGFGDPDPAHDCTAGSNTWGMMVRWRVSGRNNTNDGYSCAAGYIANTDILAIRYAGFETVDSSALLPSGLYLNSSIIASRVMTGADKDANELPNPTGKAHLEPVIRPLVSHAYYVGASGRSCPGGQAIPSLWRVRLDAAMGLPIPEEIAPGVEQLQVRYLIDGAYVDANTVDASGDWRDVSAVRVWLLMRGECPESNLENSANYAMGDIGTWPIISPDNYRRQLYVNTVMLRNNRVR